MDVERARSIIAAEPPRRLRMDELLRELGASDAPNPPADRAPSISLGELVDRAAEAGFGFVIGVLALLAIPFVGLSTPFGLVIALVGAQLALGRHRPWLPARARRRELSITMLDRILRLFAKRTRWLARSTRRRWERFIAPRLSGFSITLLGLGLALPLPIPGSNLIFIVPILVYSIALLERDGLWSALGHVGTLVDGVLIVVSGATVVAVLQRLWSWIG